MWWRTASSRARRRRSPSICAPIPAPPTKVARGFSGVNYNTSDPIAAAKAAIEEAIAKSIALSTPVTIQWTPDVEDELRARPDFGHAVATRRHLTPTSLEVCGGGSGQEGMWRLILEQAAD